MKRLLILALTTLVLALPAAVQAHVLAARHGAFPVTVVDDLHHRVTIVHLPRRIITLDPRDTETVFALGLEKRLVADGSQYVEGASGFSRDFRYPSEWPSRWGRDYPVRSKTLAHIEGGFGTTPFDLEKITSINPDLVISLNSDAATLQKMRDLKLPVMVLDPANIKGILHDIMLVGQATGATSQAATVVRTITQQLRQVSRRLSHVKRHPKVYYEIDATNPTEPITAGPGTFIDEAIHRAGGKNIADGVATCSGTTCYPGFSLESLVQIDPDIIVLGDSNYGTTPDAVKSRSGWSTIAAIQHNKVYPFNDDLISRAGPRIGLGVQALARLIHPEAFR